ncbi:36729_t:CDS:2 [Gigaspora margarita]|uniref:36729_t:CDS:1 n=1 Tax=Gigaspora margarita TaxID=4874 RepID=A0ABN7W2N6_GIGMA|nr:36729_t:CDS:2 [Gigaspora margarita]
MSAITTKFVTDHKLTNKTSLEELSQYAPEILGLLTTGTPLVDKEKRHQARNCLQKGYEFSKEQVFVLIPHEKIGRKEETIKQTAQRIMKDKLSEKDVKAISRTLVETSSDAVVALSRLSRLRRELWPLNASEKIISATLNPEITRSSNKIQKERSEKCKNEGIDFPDHFSLESVKERLDLYDVSNIPDKQALADVMIMLCIRPAEIKNLRISNGGVTSYAKNWGQQDISHLRDPGKLGSTYLSIFLKKDEFIPKPYKPLLPSSLRKLGSVFASVVHSAKNLSEANTFASEALRHSPENHASPSDRYTIVNFRRRGQPYDLARAFKLSDEN